MSQEPSIASIIASTAEAFGVTRLEIISHRRHHLVVRARQCAMWLARRLTRHSYLEIGREIGRRDHSTILYGVRVIAGLIHEDQTLKAKLLRLEAGLLNQTAEAAE